MVAQHQFKEISPATREGLVTRIDANSFRGYMFREEGAGKTKVRGRAYCVAGNTHQMNHKLGGLGP
jgi:hypothetical protein